MVFKLQHAKNHQAVCPKCRFPGSTFRRLSLFLCDRTSQSIRYAQGPCRLCALGVFPGVARARTVFTDFPSFFDHRRLFPGTPVGSFWNASAPRYSSRPPALLDPTWSLELNNTLFPLHFVMTRSSGKLFSYFEPISSSAKMVKIFNLSSVEEN